MIYSQRKWSFLEESVLSRTIEGLLYTCGSVLKGLEVEARPDENASVLTLFERVFVRENLTCNNPMEIPYYSDFQCCVLTVPAVLMLAMKHVRDSILFVNTVEVMEYSQ